MIGVILSPVYIGFLIGLLFYGLLTYVKTPLIVGIMTYYTHNTSLAGGINDYIYNPIVFVLFFIIIYSIIMYKGTFENTNYNSQPSK
jgi:hypothetical protein